MTNSEWLLIIATILFGVAGVISLTARSIVGALVPVGLALVALAFVIV